MATPWQKDKESGSCCVKEAGCLRWLLVYVGVLKKQVLIPVKECLSSRVDELGSESKGGQAKNQQLPSSVFFYVGCSQKMWLRVSVGLLIATNADLGQVIQLLNDSTKKIHRCAQMLAV